MKLFTLILTLLFTECAVMARETAQPAMLVPSDPGIVTITIDAKEVSSQKDAKGYALVVGDKVMTADGYVGAIAKLFDNGKAVVKCGVHELPFIYNVSDLFRQVDSFKGISVGDNVRTDDGHIGTVEMLFNNGKVIVKRGAYGLSVAYQFTSLFKQI